ncbi:hypothetical protein [Paenibacillus massiliensis]|uniref:hypothetical protein n=1 Tax=Paenibacillus massiliensis TaxID=225917 RepID=UPI00040C6670|nr:hypothetical protein [Paenibacillus massiliensis]
MKKTSTLARFLLFDMSLYKFLDVIGEQQAPVVFDLNHIPIPPLDGKQLPDLLGWMTCIPTGILEDRIKRIGVTQSTRCSPPSMMLAPSAIEQNFPISSLD